MTKQEYQMVLDRDPLLTAHGNIRSPPLSLFPRAAQEEENALYFPIVVSSGKRKGSLEDECAMQAIFRQQPRKRMPFIFRGKQEELPSIASFGKIAILLSEEAPICLSLSVECAYAPFNPVFLGSLAFIGWFLRPDRAAEGGKPRPRGEVGPSL